WGKGRVVWMPSRASAAAAASHPPCRMKRSRSFVARRMPVWSSRAYVPPTSHGTRSPTSARRTRWSKPRRGADISDGALRAGAPCVMGRGVARDVPHVECRLLTFPAMPGTGRIRIAAVGDIHYAKGTQASLQQWVPKVADHADVLVLCGDLT